MDTMATNCNAVTRNSTTAKMKLAKFRFTLLYRKSVNLYSCQIF